MSAIALSICSNRKAVKAAAATAYRKKLEKGGSEKEALKAIKVKFPKVKVKAEVTDTDPLKTIHTWMEGRAKAGQSPYAALVEAARRFPEKDMERYFALADEQSQRGQCVQPETEVADSLGGSIREKIYGMKTDKKSDESQVERFNRKYGRAKKRAPSELVD